MEYVWRFIGVTALLLAIILTLFTIDTIVLWWCLCDETTDEWMKRQPKKQQQDVNKMCDNLPRDNNGNLTDQVRQILARDFS